MIALAATASLATLSYGALQAQDSPPLATAIDASTVQAGTYVSDPSHTLVGWRVNHFNFNDYFGIFGDIEGSLTLYPSNISATKLDVTIPIASVTVASTGLHDHLLRAGEDGKKPDFFGPAPAPAHFVSTAVQKTGATTANITGNLTLNGKTRPVTIAAELTGAGVNAMSKAETIGFEGRAQIKRSEFGVDAFVPMVSDEVVLDITAAFEKQ
ncbi:polyisoprenoid-binding protein [Altericroceibacterium spongiae]|uniref:Polyisoprenoid-binding protein n=2 Tax=Altericroceibacterium spongiae TaxID=2320269 RepID=A0A420ECH1_9SPHN|nr:polyisoprenoid-binding protein [Altericroceibacterium spongiae]